MFLLFTIVFYSAHVYLKQTICIKSQLAQKKNLWKDLLFTAFTELKCKCEIWSAIQYFLISLISFLFRKEMA